MPTYPSPPSRPAPVDRAAAPTDPFAQMDARLARLERLAAERATDPRLDPRSDRYDWAYDLATNAAPEAFRRRGA